MKKYILSLLCRYNFHAWKVVFTDALAIGENVGIGQFITDTSVAECSRCGRRSLVTPSGRRYEENIEYGTHFNGKYRSISYGPDAR